MRSSEQSNKEILQVKRDRLIDRKITLLIVLWILDKLVMAILLYLI